jgi:hypothetical protein
MNGLASIFWNKEQGRLRAFWRILLQIALTVLAIILLQMIFIVPFSGFWRADGTPLGAALITGISVLATDGGMILAVLLAGRILDHRPLVDFGFHFDSRWWGDLAFGLALGALLMVFIFSFELAAGWVEVVDTFRGDYGVPFSVAILFPVLIYVLVGVGEETAFRGYMLRNMAEGLNLPAVGPRSALLLAWVGSSILFGFLHLFNPNATIVSTLYLMLAGGFLGLAYVLTGELAMPIGIHITWNFFQGNVFGFPVSGSRISEASLLVIRQRGPDLFTGGAFGPEAGIIGIGALVLGCLLILWWVRRRRRRIALEVSLAEYRRERQVYEA